MKRRQLLKTGVKTLIGISATALPFQYIEGNNSSSIIHDDKKTLRLCCNENPYGPSPLARQAIQQQIQTGNLYPREMHKKLKRAIANKNGLSPDHILISAGSASILQLIGLWIGQQQQNIVSADYTFSWLMRYAANFGSEWIKVPLNKHFHYDLKGIRQKVNQDTGLVYFCNPNNPTGTYTLPDEAHAFIKTIASQTPMLVDEAYIEYLNHPQHLNTASLLANHPKLMIVRTFSKIYGLAGLRVGYLLANPDVIRELEKLEIGMGMSVSNTSLAAAEASLQDDSFVNKSLDLNRQAKQFITKQLAQWGIPHTEAVANFMHCDVSHHSEGLKEALEEQSITLNPISKADKTYLRISIGTIEQMQAFVKRMHPFFTS